MKKEASQEKYEEIFRSIKEEKMEWNFEDFLMQTENSHIKTADCAKGYRKTNPKFFWIAASLLLAAALLFVFKFMNKSYLENQNKLVIREIQRQKKTGEINDTMKIDQKTVAVIDTLKFEKKDTIQNEKNETGSDVTDKILSKHARMRRNFKPRYAGDSHAEHRLNNGVPDSSKIYHASYVIVNGKRIEDEGEAIKITKKAVNMLSENMATALGQAKVLEELDIDL